MKDETEVEEAIRVAAEFSEGFCKIYSRLRREGKTWSNKKIYKVYKAMHYEKRSRLKKRLPARLLWLRRYRYPCRQNVLSNS